MSLPMLREQDKSDTRCWIFDADGANGAVFHPVSSVQYPVSAITFAATNETAKRVSPVPLLPNPISHVRRFGRGQRQAEDRQSPREFRPARQTPSLPFHWRKQFL